MNVDFGHTLPRFIAALRRAPKATMEEVDRAVQRASIEGARDARERAPKAFSTLAASIRNARIGIGHHEIVAAAGYARAVEEGGQPGRLPPIEEIRKWMRIKGIRPHGTISESGLAYLIARKIHRAGTPAQPYMTPAAKTSRERLLALLPAAIQRGLEVGLA